MKKYGLSLLLIWGLLISGFVMGSNPDFKKGIQEFENDKFHNAIPYFEKTLEVDSTNAEAMYKLGVCYLHIFSFEQSLELIEKSLKVNPEVDPFQNYWHGRALHENMQFDAAIKEYESYLDKYSNENDSRRIEILKLIEQAKVGKELSLKPKYYIIENLGENVNSSYHEHSPILTQDGKTLIFTSQRPYDGHQAQDPDGHYYETIFVSTKGQDGTWGNAKPISNNLEHQGHDACIQLFDNDTKMLVYRQTKQGDFYVSELKNGSWSAPKPLKEINTGSYEVDASISSDGTKMYFATDKYTKERHLDIYLSLKQEDGTWGKPVALPDNINTLSDENAPFISNDGNTLYFCSNSEKSMGGYDIFKTTKTADGNWTDPVNMGMPVNSMDNDIHYLMASNSTTSYFSSHRENGLGEMDIYSATPVPFVEIKGKLMSSRTNDVIDNDSIQVLFSSLADSRFDYHTRDSLKSGSFSPKLISANTYKLLVLKDKDTLYRENMKIELASNNHTVIEKTIIINYAEPEAVMTAAAVLASSEALEQRTLYFDYDRSSLNKSEKEKLDQLLEKEGFKTSSLRLVGHTDAKGDASYNLKLSKKRALAVEKYLKKNGVKAGNISYEAKGEENPVAPNDTDEGRAKNRRVEILIK